MAQGPMSSILVTIRITVRIQESEILVHWILAFGGKARGYAYAKIEYVSVRTYLSKNRIRV